MAQSSMISILLAAALTGLTAASQASDLEGEIAITAFETAQYVDFRDHSRHRIKKRMRILRHRMREMKRELAHLERELERRRHHRRDHRSHHRGHDAETGGRHRQGLHDHDRPVVYGNVWLKF